MKLYRTLHNRGSKETPPVHFESVLDEVENTLAGNIRDNRLTEADVYAQAYLRRELRSKEVSNLSNTTSVERRQDEALKSFLERETVNKVINQTFCPPAYCDIDNSNDPESWKLLYRAREIIRDIIGDTPRINRILLRSSFGNGASANLPRKTAGAPYKFMKGASVTKSLSPYVQHLYGISPAWENFHMHANDGVLLVSSGGECFSDASLRQKVIPGGSMDFVDKNTKTQRIIIKEPELNGFLQKGIGSELRLLLSSYTYGINLNRSGTRNARLASIGSRSGAIATVDAKAASDSLTVALFEFMLPEQWMSLLCLARSPYVKLPNGAWHRLQMLAGMGNGFCFELESILFYSIGLACAERSNYRCRFKATSIHGDDLTVPADVMTFVRSCYKRIGVVINESKSFSEGPFRESCGGHYYNGCDVKPFYKRKSDGRTRGDWFWLYNSLLVWFSKRGTEYKASYGGRRLLQILSYLRWYASSGDPDSWVTPISYSRRSGLWDGPVTARAWYHTTQVVSIQVVRSYPDEGRYLAWLNQPQVSATPIELLFGRSQSALYESQVETLEVERRTAVAHWPLPPNKVAKVLRDLLKP